MFRNDRSLEETGRKLKKKDPRLIETALSRRLAGGDSVRVLEVGFGQGRALVELASRFRNSRARFYGVDLTRRVPVESREDLRGVARHFGVRDAELPELPEVFFYDASQLHFESESIDLVYSAVTVRHMERKAEFLEEVCRVLAPGGRALIHIGEANWNYPHGYAEPAPRLTPYLCRLVLRRREELVPLPAYLKLFEDRAFSFGWIERRRCVLEVVKHASAELDLELDFDAELSMPMRALGFEKSKGGLKGGFRSVYSVSERRYRQLHERGLLGHIIRSGGPRSDS